MIWSRYNEFIHNSDGYFLFNCRTRKWLTLMQELFELINIENLNVDSIMMQHPELYQCLTQNQFIVEDNAKETSECISEVDNILDNHTTLKLTINPTLDCNLRCWYCYENHLKGSCMSDDMVVAVMKYVEKTLSTGQYKRFQLSFFGGEPLLKYKQVVSPLIKAAKKVCLDTDVELALAFTSNGVLLSNKVLSEIKDITSNASFQIPFDGDERFHNGIKKYPNGKGCYDIVRRNAREALHYGFRVTVRCNYTRDNVRSFRKVVGDFSDLLHNSNLRFSFHKVWQEAEGEELKAGMRELKSEVKDKIAKSNLNSYFGDSINPCYADYSNNFVINYNGDLFKCTARDFKPEHRLGKITEDGELVFNEKAIIRAKHTKLSECYMCRRLPICPICSQVRSESPDGKCPVHITQDEISQNIQEYFMDLYNQQKE